MDAGLEAVKTAFKKVANKAGQFLGNQTADAITESTVRKKNQRQDNFEEIIIPPEKKR